MALFAGMSAPSEANRLAYRHFQDACPDEAAGVFARLKLIDLDWQVDGLPSDEDIAKVPLSDFKQRHAMKNHIHATNLQAYGIGTTPVEMDEEGIEELADRSGVIRKKVYRIMISE